LLTIGQNAGLVQGVSIVCAVSASWARRYGPILTDRGCTLNFVEDGSSLVDALVSDWSVGLVIVDLALAVPELGPRLGPAGPRVLAFGNAANSGIALAANLADFIVDEPDDDGLVAAIDAALAITPGVGVADLSDRKSARMGALGLEAERVASALARLATEAVSTPPAPISSAAVRALIRARQARERFLPAELFGDPAWDMLLDLFVAHLDEREVSVSSLCIAARVPTTTALRWIRTLCDAGLFERRNDPADARRAFVSLSPEAAAAMAAYLGQFGQPGI
jgi:hypothetical protein